MISLVITKVMGGSKTAKFEDFLLNKPPEKEATAEDVLALLANHATKE